MVARGNTTAHLNNLARFRILAVIIFPFEVIAGTKTGTVLLELLFLTAETLHEKFAKTHS
jgi:hypothetical protein